MGHCPFLEEETYFENKTMYSLLLPKAWDKDRALGRRIRMQNMTQLQLREASRPLPSGTN